jgi:hypothetical protein
MHFTQLKLKVYSYITHQREQTGLTREISEILCVCYWLRVRLGEGGGIYVCVCIYIYIYIYEKYRSAVQGLSRHRIVVALMAEPPVRAERFDQQATAK